MNLFHRPDTRKPRRANSRAVETLSKYTVCLFIFVLPQLKMMAQESQSYEVWIENNIRSIWIVDLTPLKRFGFGIGLEKEFYGGVEFEYGIAFSSQSAEFKSPDDRDNKFSASHLEFPLRYQMPLFVDFGGLNWSLGLTPKILLASGFSNEEGYEDYRLPKWNLAPQIGLGARTGMGGRFLVKLDFFVRFDLRKMEMIRTMEEDLQARIHPGLRMTVGLPFKYGAYERRVPY